MRAVLAASFVASSMVAIALAACSEEKDSADPSALAGGDGGSGRDGAPPIETPGDGQANPSDGGKEHRAPDGCLLQTTGFKVGAKIENVDRTDISGAVPWTNLPGAKDVDQTFAEVVLDDGQQSAELRVSDFGFTVPEGAATWGIEAELKRRAPQGGIEDVRIDIQIDNQIPGFKLMRGPWPKSIVGTHVYGQAVDTWRVDLNPSDVNKTTFALKLWVRKSGDAGVAGPVPALVESLKAAIWYCPPK